LQRWAHGFPETLKVKLLLFFWAIQAEWELLGCQTAPSDDGTPRTITPTLNLHVTIQRGRASGTATNYRVV
jgi:hypothetical protein